MTYYAGTTNVTVTLSTGVDLATVDEVWVRIVAPNQAVSDLLGTIVTPPGTDGLVSITIAGPLRAGTYYGGVTLHTALTRDVTCGKWSLVCEDTVVPSDPSP